MGHGGARHWLEELRQNKESTDDWTLAMNGRPRPRPTQRKSVKRDISYRHHKRLLVNLVTELEYLSTLEMAWELEQPVKNLDNGVEHVRVRRQHSATSALLWYLDSMDFGMVDHLERDDAMFMRKRGREWEVSTDPNYPEDGCSNMPTWLQTTTAQREFIEKSEVPQVHKAELGILDSSVRPKQKRRRIDVGVRFNIEVYVRN